MNKCRYMKSSGCVNRLALPQYGARPSVGVCAQCEYSRGFRGFGDVAAFAFSFLIKQTSPANQVGDSSPNRISSCGCKGRQAALNAALPFDDKEGEVSP
jgi:hypothetical protein